MSSPYDTFPESLSDTTPFLRSLQMVDQLGVALLLQVKLPLEEGHLLLQPAYPLLCHGQLRLSALPVARRVVVQHHLLEKWWLKVLMRVEAWDRRGKLYRLIQSILAGFNDGVHRNLVTANVPSFR